jgi:ribosomal protein S18 acetylase RimI-like enzyme
MVALEIRLAEVSDLSAVRSLRTASSGAGRLEEVVERGALLVAVADGEIVGSLIAAFDGWRGNMYRLAVHSAHRRRGIARALVQAGEQELRARGAERVTALVDGEAARDLWSDAGYVHDAAMQRYVKDLA